MAKRTKEQRKQDNIKKETARRIAAGDTSSYVVKSAKKYGLEMPKVPGKGRYTKSTVNPTDKFEGAKDRARANQAYLDQSDRDFKKKIQELNRRRIIDDARTGSMDKSDFTGKDGSGIFGLGGNRVGQTYVNPETGKSFNFSKAREGLTSPQYSDWIRKNLGGPNAGRIENQAFRRTFPFASGAGLEKLMNLAAPFPLKMLSNLSKSDAGTMVGDLGGRKFMDFLSKFGDGTDNKIAKINLDAKKSTGELIDEVQDSTGLNSFRNYLSNFPAQQPTSSFVEDPRVGLTSDIEDELITEYSPVIDDTRRKAAYIQMKTGVDVSNFTNDQVNQLYDREKKSEETMRFQEENLNPPGVIDFSSEDLVDISGTSENTDQSTPDIITGLAPNELLPLNTSENFDTGLNTSEGQEALDILQSIEPNKYDGGYLKKYDDGGYANMSTYQKLKMMADSYGD